MHSVGRRFDIDDEEDFVREVAEGRGGDGTRSVGLRFEIADDVHVETGRTREGGLAGGGGGCDCCFSEEYPMECWEDTGAEIAELGDFPRTAREGEGDEDLAGTLSVASRLGSADTAVIIQGLGGGRGGCVSEGWTRRFEDDKKELERSVELSISRLSGVEGAKDGSTRFTTTWGRCADDGGNNFGGTCGNTSPFAITVPVNFATLIRRSEVRSTAGGGGNSANAPGGGNGYTDGHSWGSSRFTVVISELSFSSEPTRRRPRPSGLTTTVPRKGVSRRTKFSRSSDLLVIMVSDTRSSRTLSPELGV